MVEVAAKDQRLRLRTVAILVVPFVMILVGIQALLFFNEFTPRLARANTLLFELMVEKSKGELLRNVEMQIEVLETLGAEDGEVANDLAASLEAFGNHFAVSPNKAIVTLQATLPPHSAVSGDAASAIASLRNGLDLLQKVYADPYTNLQSDLAHSPLYLWPTAPFLARASGYRRATAINNALYLAQIGETGTARVILTGLHASVEDSATLGVIYYTLGRLQFELFKARPKAEYYLQSVQYLRQSLQVDPDAQLAKRFFDYLLSLNQAASVPRTGEGTSTTPSDGEGAMDSADKRVF